MNSDSEEAPLAQNAISPDAAAPPFALTFSKLSVPNSPKTTGLKTIPIQNRTNIEQAENTISMPKPSIPPSQPVTIPKPKKKKKVLSNSAMEARRKNKFSRPPKKIKSPNGQQKRKRISLTKPRKKKKFMKKLPKKEDPDIEEYKPVASRAPRMDPSERYRDSKLCEYCSEHSSSGRLHSSQEKTLQLCYACYCYERSNGFLVPKEDRKSSGSRNRKRKRPVAPEKARPKVALKKKKTNVEPAGENSLLVNVASGKKSFQRIISEVQTSTKKQIRITFPKYNPKMSKSTNFKGVRENLSRRKGENKYIAEIVVNGSPSLLGSYEAITDAAKAVNYRCEELGLGHLNPGIGTLKPIFSHNKKLRLTKYEGVKQHQNGKFQAVVNWEHIRKFTLGADFDNAEDAAKVINGFYKYIDLPLPFPELPCTHPNKQFVLTKYEGVRRRYGKQGGDYQAFLSHKDQRINLGPTDTAQEACEVINYKCKELGIAVKFPQFGSKKPIMLEMTEYEGVYYANPGIKKGPFAVRFSKTGESNGVLFSYYLQRNLGQYKTKDEACAAINYKCRLLGMPQRFPHVGWMRPHKGVRRDEGYLKEESLGDKEQIEAGRYDPPKAVKLTTRKRSPESGSIKEDYDDIRKLNRPYTFNGKSKRGDFYMAQFNQGGVTWRIYATCSKRRAAKHVNYLCDILGCDRPYPKSKAAPAAIFEEWQRRLNEGHIENVKKNRKRKRNAGDPEIDPIPTKFFPKFDTVFQPQGLVFNWMFSYVNHEGRKHLAGMFKSSREAAIGANQLAIALGAEMPYPDLGLELNKRRNFYGVFRVNDLDCYHADFSQDGKKYDLGQYETAEAAAAAVHYQLLQIDVEVPTNLRTIDPVPPNSVLIADVYGKPPEGENVQVYKNVEWRKRRQVWVGTVNSDGRSYNVSANTQIECAQRLNLKCEELGEKWLNPDAGLPADVMQTPGEERLERVDATDEVISQWIQEEIEREGKCPRRVVRAKFNCTPKRLQRIMGKILGAMKEEEKSNSPPKMKKSKSKSPSPESMSSAKLSTLVEDLLEEEQKEMESSPAPFSPIDFAPSPASAKRIIALPANDTFRLSQENVTKSDEPEPDCQIAIEASAEIISPVPSSIDPIEEGKLSEGFWVPPKLKESEGSGNIPLCGSPQLLPMLNTSSNSKQNQPDITLEATKPSFTPAKEAKVMSTNFMKAD